MSLFRLPSFLIFVVLTAIFYKGTSQTLAADTLSSPTEKNTVSLYSAAMTEQLYIFNGKEFEDYILPFDEGQPFFVQSNWLKGTVIYDGNRYKDVSILYNLLTDDVIILSYNKIAKIRLIKEKVEEFSIAGHSFINIRSDSLLSNGMAGGFYDVLSSGTVTLLAKRTKNVQTQARQKVERRIYGKDHYFLKKNNEYFPLHGKKSLMEQLGGKKKEIQQYIKQNNLRFRKDQENTMVKITNYYNQLTR